MSEKIPNQIKSFDEFLKNIENVENNILLDYDKVSRRYPTVF